ncbi:hypothetical protein PIN17_A1592 [Prevotella intermedia 17]|nr:hypothetical protein PIN17_A1592 [Prevotella intermedia 17]APW34494.1 hypothetical protein BWX40_06390 [Prevotella intermedia]
MFCIPKVAVLHGESVGFASQNSRFRNAKTKLSFFFRIIFTSIRENVEQEKGTCQSYRTSTKIK